MEAAFVELEGRDDVFDFPFGGHTDRAITRQAYGNLGREVDDAGIDRFLAAYLGKLERMIAESAGYEVLPRVPELLDRLEGAPGVAIGLGTGNVEPGARAKLRRGGLDGRFGFGGFGSDHEERPRLLDIGAARGAAQLGVPRHEVRVVVIGDTPRDIAAARAIGAACVAVPTGGFAAEALAAADRVVEDVRAAEGFLLG